MNIQSLSIVVPNRNCVNDCRFCVSKMHNEDIKDKISPAFSLYDNLPMDIDHIYIHEEEYEDDDCNFLKQPIVRDYIERLNFARDNGCNTVILTGKSEPQQNKKFLLFFAYLNKKRLEKPFRCIELQTTGVMLDDKYLAFLRNVVGVSTISLSISSFNSTDNAAIIGMPEKLRFELPQLCRKIKNFGFNLRLSINLTNFFNCFKYNPEELFEFAKKEFLADQVTLRKLYYSGSRKQSEWVNRHSASDMTLASLKSHVHAQGTALETLPYGSIKYSLKTLHGNISVVMDWDCMAKASGTSQQNYKYLILQPDCHLYSRWDDEASLIF